MCPRNVCFGCVGEREAGMEMKKDKWLCVCRKEKVRNNDCMYFSACFLFTCTIVYSTIMLSSSQQSEG